MESEGDHIENFVEESAPSPEPDPEFEEVLKRTRSLFWKQKIWEKSRGAKGQEVTLESLSEKDQDALHRVRLQRGGHVEPEMMEFIERVLKHK